MLVRQPSPGISRGGDLAIGERDDPPVLRKGDAGAHVVLREDSDDADYWITRVR